MDDIYISPTTKYYRRVGEDPQVKVARNKFRSVLKHMAQEKTLHDDESESDNEGSGYRYKYKSGINIPGRKRHKSGHETPKAKVQPAFVMKLFDRGVDLAQFNDATPLYPICRAWIQNKPHATRQRREAEAEEEQYELDEMDYREETGEVFHLEHPEPLPFDEYGNQISYRVPPPLGPSEMDEPFDINYAEEDAPSPAVLFQNHLERWNIVRHRWKQASAFNDFRYSGSLGMLRLIYERNRPDDTTMAVTTTLDADTELQMQMVETVDGVDGQGDVDNETAEVVI